MATEFGEEMKKQLEAFKANAPAAAIERKKAEVEYQVESSGIDLVVTRVTNGKPASILYIYLSQLNENGIGTMFIKTLKGGVMKEATEETVA